MRSVYLFFSDAGFPEISAALDLVANRTGDERSWSVGDSGWPLLKMAVDDHMEDLEPVNFESARTRLGRRPSLLVIVDVSGRYSGSAEVVGIVQKLLSELPGVAQDDHSSHSWSVDEIQAGKRINGLRFFLG